MEYFQHHEPYIPESLGYDYVPDEEYNEAESFYMENKAVDESSEKAKARVEKSSRITEEARKRKRNIDKKISLECEEARQILSALPSEENNDELGFVLDHLRAKNPYVGKYRRSLLAAISYLSVGIVENQEWTNHIGFHK